MFFRIVGWLSLVAMALGIIAVALDVVGVRSTLLTPAWSVSLFLAALFVSGVVAAIETFFFRRLPRRERWLEYYKQSFVPLSAIEVLLSHRRRD